jgi:glutaredoxin 3
MSLPSPAWRTDAHLLKIILRFYICAAVVQCESEMAQVTIYTRQFCGYSTAAKRLLKDKGARIEEIDATFSPERRSEMVERSGRGTFPQIFIGERHVGGCDDLYALDSRGELDPLLAA